MKPLLGRNTVPFLASMLGFLGVALGAFGAHSLRESISPKMLSVWNTATLYLFVHVFASYVAHWRGSKRIGALFLFGTLLFSGSLYMMVLTGFKVLGMITPLGGVVYLLSWASLAYVFYTEKE